MASPFVYCTTTNVYDSVDVFQHKETKILELNCTISLVAEATLQFASRLVCFSTAVSSVVLFIVQLGSRGVRCDGGKRRCRHAGCLHKINVLTGQTRHQFLTGCTFSKEKLVRHSGQQSADYRPDPINLQG